MTQTVYFVELTGILKSDGTTSRTFGFCDGDEGYNVREDDSGLALTDHYPPLVVSPGSWRQSIIGKSGLFGKTDSQRGTVRLENQAGSLDEMRLYAFDGRVAKIMRGELDTSGALTGTPTTMLLTRIQRVQVGIAEVIVDFADRAAELSGKQLQPQKYAGDTGATGYEGDENLANRPLPHCWGTINDLSPPQVATGYLIFQLSDTRIQSITEVTVGGDAITVGTSYSSFNSLKLATTTAGTYDYYLGDNGIGFDVNGNTGDGAYIKLGTLPDFTVTCTFDGYTDGFVFPVTVTDIAFNLLAFRLGYDISAGSVDVYPEALNALETLSSAPIGAAYLTEVAIAAVFDDLFGSIGAWWGFDRLGRFTCGRLDLPDTTATPDLELTADDLLGGDDDEAIQVVDLGILGGVPVGRVQLGWGRNYTVLKGGQLDPNVTAADRLYYGEEFRLAPPSSGLDQDVLDLHPLSKPFQHHTYLANQSDANTEQARLLTMLSAETIVVRVAVLPNLVSSIDLGAHVSITLDRLGMDNGMHFTLVQIEEDYGEDEATLVLWGEQAA